MSKRFDHRVALITGGASGIGKETAKILASEGASVVISDINFEAAQKVADEINNLGGKAVANKADTSIPEDVKAAVDFAVNTFGGLHLAFNNAGIIGALKPIIDLEITEWKKVLDINLSAIFYGLKYEIPAILASGGGSIVNTSSIMGLVGQKTGAGYVTSKHGVVGLTKVASLEYASQGIRVNSVHLGFVDTPILAGEELDELAKLHPIGRLGKPEEVAHVAAFLLSDEASFVTGAQYAVDGSYTSQ